MIRPYYRVFLNHMAARLGYKWGVLTGIAVHLVQMLTTIFVWRSIFRGNPAAIQGYSFNELATYLILVSLLTVSFSASHIFRLSGLVRKGTLNAYLVRPYSFLGDSSAVFAGTKAVELVASGAVAFVLWSAGVVKLHAVSWTALVLVFSNFILLFLFGSVLGALSFWLVEMWPMKPLYNSLMALLGGTLFPLNVLPPDLAHVLAYTPFSLFGFVNARALQGAFSQTEVLRFIAVSVGWNIVSYIVYTLLWRYGLRRYEGVSG